MATTTTTLPTQPENAIYGLFKRTENMVFVRACIAQGEYDKAESHLVSINLTCDLIEDLGKEQHAWKDIELVRGFVHYWRGKVIHARKG